MNICGYCCRHVVHNISAEQRTNLPVDNCRLAARVALTQARSLAPRPLPHSPIGHLTKSTPGKIMLYSILDVLHRSPSRERLRVKPSKTKKMKSPIETLDAGQVPPTRGPCLRCQAEVRPVKPGKTILTDSSGRSGPVKPMPGRGSAKTKNEPTD